MLIKYFSKYQNYAILICVERCSCKYMIKEVKDMSEKTLTEQEKIKKFLSAVNKRYYYPEMEHRKTAGAILQNYGLSGSDPKDTYQDLKLLEKRNRR